MMQQFIYLQTGQREASQAHLYKNGTPTSTKNGNKTKTSRTVNPDVAQHTLFLTGPIKDCSERKRIKLLK